MQALVETQTLFYKKSLHFCKAVVLYGWWKEQV